MRYQPCLNTTGLIKKFLDKLSETLEIPCFYYGNILAAVGRLAVFGHEKMDFKFGLFLKSFHLILLFLYLTFYFFYLNSIYFECN